MAKILTLTGPSILQTAICDALRQYAEAAYPPGGSECGQVARAALMDAADALQSGFTETGTHAEVSRRLRAHMKAAVRYYSEQHQHGVPLTCMEKFIMGVPITNQQLESGCDDGPV